MLKFVTKKHYWDSLDREIDGNIKETTPWHLKSIQDVVVADHLEGISGKKVAEIGGGNSRLLEWLANDNEVYNIEPFEGDGGGPTTKIKVPGVQNVYCLVGDSKKYIQDESFDVIFSISVVEHVPTHKLDAFTSDCWRILKPGGQMVHAVDMYLVDDPEDETNIYNSKRLSGYLRAFKPGGFLPLDESQISLTSDLSFSSEYASNPDSMMRQWNRSVPKLKPLRERAQSVSLLWGGTK